MLHKRAGRAATAWPLLAAAHGADWTSVFRARFDGVGRTAPRRRSRPAAALQRLLQRLLKRS